MRSFELYLDESGSFSNESNEIHPSLIGGILVKKDELSIKEAQEIMEVATKNITGKYVHINDISKIDKKLSGSISIEILKQIKNIPAYLVVFENNELLDFKDDKLLYLNIIAEGLVNLAEKLSLEKNDSLELNVVAAVRRDLSIDDDKTIIDYSEYSSKIKERIYMKIAENNLFLSKNLKISFELSSARKNAKLMLSDVVCNARLTRDSSKFNEEEKATLKTIFSNSKYIFNVFRDNIQKKLSAYLMQNNIVDAIFLLNECDNKKDRRELDSLVINNINTMPLSNLRIQLELLSLKIRSLIDVHRNLFLCESFLLSIQEEVLPSIKVKDYVILKLKLDISLYLLTIYTHLGDNIKSKEQIRISEENIAKISGSWEFFDYYFILKIREAIYYNTCFNHEMTISVLSDAVEKYEKILKTMEEMDEFKNVKSDTIAKIVGTRLQAYTSVITKNMDEKLKEEYYTKAVNDSDFAIHQFISKEDKKRQYQYRCMLELSVDKLDNALKYLMMIADLNEVKFDKFMDYLVNVKDFSQNFVLVNYLEVMQYAKNNKKGDIADKMYMSFEKSTLYNKFALKQEDEDVLFKNDTDVLNIHPFEYIYFNLAKYFKESNKYVSTCYYDKAISICEAMDESTVNVIELEIIADKLTISDDVNSDKDILLTKYNAIMDDKRYEDIHAFLNKLSDEFSYISMSSDDGEIKEACDIIASEIKI